MTTMAATNTTTAATVQKATRRDWIGLAVLALACVLYAVDLTVLNVAVPAISADLKPTSSQLLWLVDIYGFLVAGLLIPMGTLGDRIGRRRLLMFGASAFGLASVAAAFSNSAEMLIAMRALLGVAGATLAPSTLSLIRNMFHDPRQRTVAIGVWMTSFSVGGAIGPLLGGIVLHYFTWHVVFLLAVPVMALLLALAPSLLPEFKDPQARRLDFVSSGLSLTAVLAVIYGVKKLAEHGFGWDHAAFIVGGLAVGALFIARQQRLADPMIDVRLFRHPAFGGSLAIALLVCFVAFGPFLFLTQYLQLVRGFTPLVAALWTLPWALTFTVGSNLTPFLLRYMTPQVLLAGGLMVAALGYVLMAQLDAGLLLLVGGNMVVALGLAPVSTLTTDLIVGAAPPERAGAASAISETAYELGGALGIAVLGSVGTAVYRGMIAEANLTGIPAAATAAALDTLGGANAVAEGLSAIQSVQLLGTAREAFAFSLEILCAISAAIMIAAAAIAVLTWRKTPTTLATH